MAAAVPDPSSRRFALLEVAFAPKVAAAALAVVFAGAGAVVFLTYGPTDATSASAAAAVPAGDVHFAGRISSSWVEGDGSLTHFGFVGAPGMDVQVPGNVLGRFARGSFVEVAGARHDSNVTATSFQSAREPLASALPYFVAASALAAGLIGHLVFARWGPDAAPLAGLARWARSKRAGPGIDEAGEREGDNHSGAPTPKS